MEDITSCKSASTLSRAQIAPFASHESCWTHGRLEPWISPVDSSVHWAYTSQLGARDRMSGFAGAKVGHALVLTFRT